MLNKNRNEKGVNNPESEEAELRIRKNAENVFLEATYLLLNDNNKDVNDKNSKQKDCCIF